MSGKDDFNRLMDEEEEAAKIFQEHMASRNEDHIIEALKELLERNLKFRVLLLTKNNQITIPQLKLIMDQQIAEHNSIIHSIKLAIKRHGKPKT